MLTLLRNGEVRSIRRAARARQGAASRFCAAVCAALLCAATCRPGTARAEWIGDAIDLMGTRVSVELWHADAARGARLVEDVLDEYRRIDRLMSTYKADSAISRLNASAAREAVAVDAELFSLVERAQRLSAASGGAFDVTYDSVGQLYDFRAERRPDERQIEAALPSVGYRHLVLDARARTIRYRTEGVRINLGGIAKGYAVERAAALLRAAGVEHAVLNAGGDTRVLGDRRGQAWIVGIRHPRTDGAVVTRVPLVDEAISTSGDYERFFEAEGRRWHHILNPATGRPTEGVSSATVIGPDGTLTDGLSTTVFVLGAEAGLALIEAFDGYEAVLVEGSGRLSYSSGLAPGDVE